MGNRSWGKGYYTGLDKGVTKGLLIAFSIVIADKAISSLVDYISTRKIKAKEIIEKKST